MKEHPIVQDARASVCGGFIQYKEGVFSYEVKDRDSGELLEYGSEMCSREEAITSMREIQQYNEATEFHSTYFLNRSINVHFTSAKKKFIGSFHPYSVIERELSLGKWIL